MKKIYILSLLLILTSHNIFSQGGWFIIHPFPNTNENLNDIHFINPLTGFLVTDQYGYPSYSGRIYKTTNGGLNWNRTLLDTNGHITKIYFIDNISGFAFGSKLYKTTDAGMTWIFKGTAGYKAMSFINMSTGYACGLRDEYRAIISKTTNGGDTWGNFYTDITGYYLSMYDIHFWNATTGIIIGEHKTCAKTTNGGVNWNYKLGRDYGIYTDIKIIQDSICYVTGNNQDSLILKSTNYGENWSVINTQFNGFAFMNSIEITSDYGFTVGTYAKIIKGNSGGNNWIELNNPFITVESYSFELNKILNLSAGTFITIGDNCNFARTTNNGNNWELYIKGDTLNAVYFINQNYGFAGGYKGHIMKTSNGGNNWLVVNSETNNTVNDLYFKDSLNGIYVGRNGVIGTTTNSGSNWIIQNIGNQITLKDIYFYSSTTGIIVGSNGKIYKTTNFGISWVEKNSNVIVNLNSISILSNNVAYSVGDSGVYIKSTDLGENWTSNLLTPRKRLNSVCFTNSNSGYIVGDSGKVFKTSNGGINWNLDLPYTNENLNIALFVNENVGYIIGKRGVCMKTTNGGVNWGFQSVKDITLNKIFAVDSTTIFITGNDGYIFKTTDGGGNLILGLNNYNDIIPHTFSLHQNYPNPFNPETKIKFDLPKQSTAKIIVYDLLGREITTLVNEQLKPGSYEIDWDGSNFASGVYFYSLVAEDPSTSLRVTETKRMVLIK